MKSEEFIREVNEELQRDRMLALWRRYGALITGAALLVVLAVAGVEGWRWWQQRQMTADAVSFATAADLLASGDRKGAADAFRALATDARTEGYAALARLSEADALDRATDQAAAEQALQSLAGDAHADPLFQELAALLLVAHQIDTGDPATLAQRLQPLTVAGRPWRDSARELLALVQIRAGQLEQARTTLGELIAGAAGTTAQRSRAEALLGSLGPAPAAAGGTAPAKETVQP